ncbi:unnamed protein product [Amoebophrya sp. A25]|nr:unnamed protein product [Amoebophrya sp. A25]|eukprot:GSA25T00017084001.1
MAHIGISQQKTLSPTQTMPPTLFLKSKESRSTLKKDAAKRLDDMATKLKTPSCLEIFKQCRSNEHGMKEVGDEGKKTGARSDFWDLEMWNEKCADVLFEMEKGDKDKGDDKDAKEMEQDGHADGGFSSFSALQLQVLRTACSGKKDSDSHGLCKKLHAAIANNEDDLATEAAAWVKEEEEPAPGHSPTPPAKKKEQNLANLFKKDEAAKKKELPDESWLVMVRIRYSKTENNRVTD